MEVLEVLLYASATWTTKKEHFDELRQLHSSFLKRIIGYRPFVGVLKTRPYWRCLIDTESEPIETTIRYRRVLWASKIVNLEDNRMTKQTLYGELNHGKRGRGTIKQWRHCLKDDLKHFNLNTINWTNEAMKDNWLERVKDQKTIAIAKFFEKSKQDSENNHLKETIDLFKHVVQLAIIHAEYHEITSMSLLDKIPTL